MKEPRATRPFKDRARTEKLSLLTSLLGKETVERLRIETAQGAGTDPQRVADPLDTERQDWHRNRLIERIKQKQTSENKQGVGAPSTARGVDQRLDRLADQTALWKEHPAVIARLLRNRSRAERVETIKSLPGPIARSVVRRLR